MFKSHTATGMLLFGAVLLASPAALAVTGDEYGGTILNTSPLYSDSGKSYPACNIANITTGAISVKTDLLSSGGTVLATSGSTPAALAAGGFQEVDYTEFTGFSRCRFTIVGNANGVRANESIFYYTGSYFETLALSEAR